MGMLGGIREGSWFVSCKSDPRWNNQGRAIGSCCGGVPDMDAWIESCKKKYGKPPADAEMGFMKD